MIQSCIIHFDDGSKAMFVGEAVIDVGDKRKVVKVQFTKPTESTKPKPAKVK